MDISLLVTDTQRPGLDRIATQRGHETARAFMQAQLDALAEMGQGALDAEAEAAWAAKRPIYEQAAPTDTKAAIEAAVVEAAKVDVKIEVLDAPVEEGTKG
jgi:hypothetical protein